MTQSADSRVPILAGVSPICSSRGMQRMMRQHGPPNQWSLNARLGAQRPKPVRDVLVGGRRSALLRWRVVVVLADNNTQ
jgi:hypothetical protein